MRPVGPSPRRDPAPTRWQYRLNRLWLTPGFRLLVRVGLPIAVVILAAGLWLQSAERRSAIYDIYASARDKFQNRPEFMVTLISIEGASNTLSEAIRVALALDLPQSSFAIDLEGARKRVETFDAVERADLRIMPGGLLQVTVVERLPVLVWRAPDGVWLVDATGHRVAQIGARSLRSDLPLIGGRGAADVAAEALTLIEAAEPLMARVRGLVRMGERRWDLVLDRSQRILLPEEAPVRALERFIALDQAEDILSRDITAVDLRNTRRQTLRLTPDAATRLRELRLAQTGG